MDKDLREVLEAVRKIWGYTQTEVAEYLGFASHSSYIYLLNNTEHINIRDFKNFQRLYNLTPNELMCIGFSKDYVIEKTKQLKKAHDEQLKQLKQLNMLNNSIIDKSTISNTSNNNVKIINGKIKKPIVK